MKNLKIRRKELGLTQLQIAKMLNVSQQCYSDYENEKTDPDLNTLSKLADLLTVSIDYLLGREDDFGNIVVQGTEEPFFTTPQEQEFIIKLRSLSSSTREMILHVLDNAVQVEKRTSS